MNSLTHDPRPGREGHNSGLKKLVQISQVWITRHKSHASAMFYFVRNWYINRKMAGESDSLRHSINWLIIWPFRLCSVPSTLSSLCEYFSYSWFLQVPHVWQILIISSTLASCSILTTWGNGIAVESLWSEQGYGFPLLPKGSGSSLEGAGSIWTIKWIK